LVAATGVAMFDVPCFLKTSKQEEKNLQDVKQTKMFQNLRQAEIEGCIAPLFVVYFYCGGKQRSVHVFSSMNF
jgi:hypothetical protein